MLAVELPSKWRNKLADELQRAGNREIGGILMGEQIAPGQFRIMEMTFQRHGGRIALFVRSARSALLALQRFFTRTAHRYNRYNYLGEWHSHPSFEARPSPTDHESMIEVACNPSTGANFVVLMIVRLDDSGSIDASLTTYLPSGMASRATLLVGDGMTAAPQSVDTHV